MTESVQIDFEPEVLAALKARAGEIHRSLSEVVNELLHEHLAEDLHDLATFEERAGEPTRPLADVMTDFRARGLL
ncbi:MAG: CopG family transcriptional regulator [Thermodesulfobacteriota bacterium]